MAIDLNRPMDEIRAELTRYPVRTRVSLTGPLVVARDIAHAKIAERLDAGEPMPAYLRDHPVYYAGPAKTPAGYASGSFGPTTAGRMDSYVDRFQAAGGSLVMLAKGNRSAAVTAACKKHGGFYLGSIGGAAARLAQDCITRVDVLEYPELGMEAVWKIEVRDFPAFIVVDDKGNDFFADPSGPVLQIIGAPVTRPGFRIEHDSMGEVEVPADALWGAQTQRAVDNFPVSGERIGRDLIGALGLHQGRGRPGQRRARRARRRHGRRDPRRGRRGGPGRARRGVPGGRVPDRFRHLEQHERQRGHRDPGLALRWAGRCTRTTTSTRPSRPTTCSRPRSAWPPCGCSSWS